MATEKQKKDFYKKFRPIVEHAVKGTYLQVDFILGQIALESGYGTSELTTKDHNYAGIKGEGTAGSSMWKTREVFTTKEWKEWKKNNPNRKIHSEKKQKNGKYEVYIDAPFRKYHNTEDGIKGVIDFYKENKRYKKVLKSTDANEQAKLVREAGWATDESYTDSIVSNISEIRTFQIPIKHILGGEDQIRLDELEVKEVDDNLSTQEQTELNKLRKKADIKSLLPKLDSYKDMTTQEFSTAVTKLKNDIDAGVYDEAELNEARKLYNNLKLKEGIIYRAEASGEDISINDILNLSNSGAHTKYLEVLSKDKENSVNRLDEIKKKLQAYKNGKLKLSKEQVTELVQERESLQEKNINIDELTEKVTTQIDKIEKFEKLNEEREIVSADAFQKLLEQESGVNVTDPTGGIGVNLQQQYGGEQITHVEETDEDGNPTGNWIKLEQEEDDIVLDEEGYDASIMEDLSQYAE